MASPQALDEESHSSDGLADQTDPGTESSEAMAASAGGLQVSGMEFIRSLNDALLEMDATPAVRREIKCLARFLVAFCSNDPQQMLTEPQLHQLTFTIRIESVVKTRRCLVDLLQSNSNISVMRSLDEGFLVPTDTFVTYLCTKTYYLRTKSGEVVDIRFTPSTAGDRSQAPGRRRSDASANFLHFLVNMFARQVPGNLVYSFSTDESASTGSDFFACVSFLRRSLLRNPMDLDTVYGHIWENFKLLSRDGEGNARVEDLKLYCLPIVSNNWRYSGETYNSSIDKKAFIEMCKDCILIR